ncbi:type IX secretion system sortase PorU [Hymenobacter humi]|uniref:Type IX secretion system sortase PorU n=1 Tax=Hymenobacter humi TaxID=1411620 RepID=A0ABW2UBK7_9BACT
MARPLSMAGATATFVAPADTLREYVALQPNGTFNRPRAFGKVPNQDLHVLNSNPNALLDLVIVTYPAFKGEAQRLASHRAAHDKLRVAVVTTAEVYNEYGSGGQDVTAIRDLMKQLYDRAPAGKQMQLLLFGDASFDYKSGPYNDKAFEPTWWKDRSPFKSDPDFDAVNQNYVPTYESRESLAPFYGGAFGQASYSSDDYYALLDDNEGEWDEQRPGSELLDMGVGRLPIRMPRGEKTNASQAKVVVDKIIGYDAVPAYGKWRNRITLVSDDGEGDLFVGQGSELIAKSIQTDYPVYNVHKVYLDLYPQVAVSAGQRSLEASRAIDQSIEQGSLIVNYLGHGGPKGWTDEQMLTNASVLALRNANNLTFFTTGTCDFSTYDNPDFTSAGEQALTDNATGGAVGLFTTTRVVDAGLNAGLNQAYFNRVLRPVNGQMPSIGTVVMLSKNDYPGAGQPGVINNRNYVLLADPSMTLAYPRQSVVLDSIRTRVAGAWAPADTLKALARVRLHGRLQNNGAFNSAFTGRAQVSIYDKPTTVMTLGNEYNPAVSSTLRDAPRPVEVQENLIYGGQAEVKNGEFSLSFVVPKDINYNIGLGKISLYAFDGTNRVDANGYHSNRWAGRLRAWPATPFRRLSTCLWTASRSRLAASPDRTPPCWPTSATTAVSTPPARASATTSRPCSTTTPTSCLCSTIGTSPT